MQEHHPALHTASSQHLLLCLLCMDAPVLVHINLVADNSEAEWGCEHSLELLDPVLGLLEGVCICHVKHNNGALTRQGKGGWKGMGEGVSEED